MESLDQDSQLSTLETRVEPHEVRELLSRLTETSIEQTGVREARTLEGLSLNTGVPLGYLRRELDRLRGRRRDFRPAVAAILAIGIAVTGWVATRPAPVSQTTPLSPTVPVAVSSAEAEKRGLVDLKSVTYGPDSGNVLVDPNFEPSQPVQPGLGISGQVADVLWGSGDPRADVLRTPLNDAEQARLESSLTELVEYIRRDATRRRLPSIPIVESPGLVFRGEGHVIHLSIRTYYGSSGGSLKVPPAGTEDAEAEKITRKVVNQIVDSLQAQLRFSEENRLRGGPR